MILVLASTPRYDREEIMDVLEGIRTRRSIRVFKPDPAPRKVLQELLDVRGWAPSGGNVQPWYFDVLADKLPEEVTARLVKKPETWDGKEYTNTKPDPPRTGPYSKFLVPRQQSLEALQDVIRYPPGTEYLEAKQLEHPEHMLRFFEAHCAILLIPMTAGPQFHREHRCGHLDHLSGCPHIWSGHMYYGYTDLMA